MIETTISNSPLVSLRGLSTSEEKDENFPEYYKAKLHLEIVCPKTRERIVDTLVVDIATIYERRRIFCRYCNGVHIMSNFDIVK